MLHESMDAGLQKLIDGNRRFVSGHLTSPHQSIERRQDIITRQEPFAIILGCSDSRVPPELIFDQGLGDLFVIRVAGNILDEAVLGSLEYAVTHLQVPLLVVLGHCECGAVKATIEALELHEHAEGHLGYIVDTIQPAVDDAEHLEGDLVDCAIHANVDRIIQHLMQSEPVISSAMNEGKLHIVAGFYDLKTGLVEFSSP